MGWGDGPWGSSPWGSGADDLELVSALAVRENVVRLFFNQAVYFSELLDPGDASNVDNYGLAPVAGTVGNDGFPARPVFPAEPRIAAIAGAGSSQIDLVTDRRFSPYPARYAVTVVGLKSAAGTLLAAGATSRQFDGLTRGLTPAIPERLVPRIDIANPQTLEALSEAAGSSLDVLQLGTYPVDDTGDYATDRGLTGYRKRVFRRITTEKNAFAHLPGYGVGILARIKTLNRPSTRQAIVADVEQQIGLEPDTASVEVSFVVQPSAPNVFFLKIKATATTGEVAAFRIPVPSA